MRHTEDHDVWGPDDRCGVLIMEDDGTVTRCGYVRSVVAFDLGPDMPKPPEPRAPRVARHVIIGVVMVVLGLLIALDWLAFWLFVSRNDANANLAADFVIRIAVSGGYAAAVVWVWRRI